MVLSTSGGGGGTIFQVANMQESVAITCASMVISTDTNTSANCSYGVAQNTVIAGQTVNLTANVNGLQPKTVTWSPGASLTVNPNNPNNAQYIAGLTGGSVTFTAQSTEDSSSAGASTLSLTVMETPTIQFSVPSGTYLPLPTIGVAASITGPTADTIQPSGPFTYHLLDSNNNNIGSTQSSTSGTTFQTSAH